MTRIRIMLLALLSLSSIEIGCGGQPLASSQPSSPPAISFTNSQAFQAIPTYEGSGQAVEPSVITFSSPWHGFRYWMAFSPYPNGDESRENPSIAASNDGVSWEVPAGLTNPLAFPSSGAHLSDASLFYDSTSNQLWIYFLEESAATGTTQVFRLSSLDGVNWKSDGLSLTAPILTVLSPSVLKIGSTYFMWTVSVDTGGCASSNSAVEYYTSLDGLNWNGPLEASYAQSGYIAWHLNISYIASKQEFWAVVNAYATGSDCAHTVLFLSKSKDGIEWASGSKPILIPSESSWDNREIYRSSVLFDPSTNRLKLWYSAASKENVWHIGLSEGVQ